MSFGVGLANATNSNTDTSARVHTTGRVCLNIYNSLTDPNTVRNNKHEYRAIKEEIALGIGRPFNHMGISYTEQKGLIPVFTNVAVMSHNRPDDLMRWYIKFYDCRSKQERIDHTQTGCVVKGLAYFPSELFFAGVVLSDGEADAIHGDNALTLMIGGKITIRNGHFDVQTGDKLQWYFEEEVLLIVCLCLVCFVIFQGCLNAGGGGCVRRKRTEDTEGSGGGINERERQAYSGGSGQDTRLHVRRTGSNEARGVYQTVLGGDRQPGNYAG
jgi:hypothetical protein